jgi:hypothetical protein
MSKAELQAALRQFRKENFQGGNAISRMGMAELRTELQAHKHVFDRSKTHPSLERTMGPAAPRPFHNKVVEDADEEGEGVRVPVIPEKKKPVAKDPRGSKTVMTPEHKEKLMEAGKKAREAKKAAQNEKKEVKALIKEPEGPSRSAPKKMCFCDCPSCPDRH